MRLKKAEENACNAAAALDVKLDSLEQYSRRNSIRIHGMEETDGESTEEAVCKVARQLGVQLAPADIDRTHRLGTKATDGHQRAGPRPIICKFTSYQARALFMGARVKLKGSGISTKT